MNIIQGRNNLSVTVYVPWNCYNNCEFCTSKKEYESLDMDILQFMLELKNIANSTIEEVVFTGGEPCLNIEKLKMLIDCVSNKRVYINTTFLASTSNEFIQLVNTTDCIKGVNISRHTYSYKEDLKITKCIELDQSIILFEKPVRINVVLNGTSSKTFLIKILDRWILYSDKVEVNLRADFRTINETNLHSLISLDKFLQFTTLEQRSFCDVCDTSSLIYKNKLRVNYHKGLEKTSILIANTLIVNDIILMPDGKLYYDWDKKSEYISEVRSFFKIEPLKKTANSHNNGILFGSCSLPVYLMCGHRRTTNSCGRMNSGGC